MPELLDDLAHLPRGSHALGFYASREEARDQAVSFLAGTPEGQASSFWVADEGLVPYYAEKLQARAPEQVGCVHVLPGEQVRLEGDKLRPVNEVLDFVRGHPEGVTGAGDTLTQYWAPSNVPEHLEYEAWFDAQPRDGSRFLCPYDLRRVPVDMAESTLRELGRHHSHVVLSSSEEPAVQLVQLFVFGIHESVPPELRDAAARAEAKGLITIDARTREMSLTPDGEQVLTEWNLRSVPAL